MKRRLAKSLLTAACVIAPVALLGINPAQAQTVSRPVHDITLSIGRGQLITLPGTMTKVYIANPSIANVQAKSLRQIYLSGKATGETTVYVSNAAGDVIWSANVRVGSNIDSVDQMLGLAMPDAKITVTNIGSDTMLLTGTIAAPEDAAEAQRLVAAYVGEKANVISRLRMATPLQVNLQVRFAEVSRTFVRAIGANLTTIDGTGGFKFGVAQGRTVAQSWNTDSTLPLGMGSSVTGYHIDPTSINPANPSDPSTWKIVAAPGTNVTPISPGSTFAGMGKLLGLNILGALDAGERMGLVTTLSQPNLTALSGETADFLAGGEYPIPISQGLGSTSIEYKKFGVSLSYTPTVLANGRISMRVRPEVSELSSQGAVVLNGFSIPSLTIRRAETTIELGSGQSFMIAGLMSNSAQNTIDKTPGAGDLPILGALFKSTSFQKGQTELVIVVTPYLVNPVNDGDIKLPTDGYQAPNDVQRLLGNLIQDGKSGPAGARPGPTMAPDANPGSSVGAVTEPETPAKPSRRSRRTAAAVDVPKPGFTIN